MKKIIFHTFHTTEPQKKQEREGKETVSTDFTAIEKYDTSI
jgi:hypothetical protein